jgi:hypothetical protein
VLQLLGESEGRNRCCTEGGRLNIELQTEIALGTLSKHGFPLADRRLFLFASRIWAFQSLGSLVQLQLLAINWRAVGVLMPLNALGYLSDAFRPNSLQL